MVRKTGHTRIIEGGLWLIRLRWLAVIGILIATTFADSILKISIQQIPLYIIAIVLLLLNVISLYAIKYITKNKIPAKILRGESIVRFQILTDLIILTFLLHYSGGVENPFIIYYIFHMIIASILLSPKTSYIITTIALLLIGALTLLEYYEILPHYALQGFNNQNFYQNKVFLLGTGFIYISTSYLVVYMTVSVSTKLKLHEIAYTKAIIELEKKDKIKNEYVLRITHDIKDHLAAIQNSLDVVLVSNSEKDRQEFIERAYKRTQRLTSFVNELLKLTRIRLINKLDTHEFSIEDSINKVIQEINPAAMKKGIKINVISKSFLNGIFGNPLSIEEALSNLISNAVKYSPDNSEIVINSTKIKDSVLVEIIDNGIGIPMHEQKLIFNEFYRASNVSNIEKESSGFGLSLAKQIIEKHNGTISVESKLNKGTTFRITLPIHHTR
jgi:signal transduction histidine kinase